MVMCGMSAAFSALFGTPAAAAVFSLEMVSVGVMYFSAVVPCSVASVTGFLLATRLGVKPVAYSVAGIPGIAVKPLAAVLCLGGCCAALSILFCVAMRKTSRWFRDKIPNVFLRAAAGGCLVVLMTLLDGTGAYNGAGMETVAAALAGQALPWAFLFKLAFTVVTLGSGYRGGEIVPVFFCGATFGCIVGALLGLDPSFGAALGLVSLFCGVTNCPITSLILSVELFGSSGLPYFLVACAASYMLSGYYSLYGEQIIVYSKTKAQFVEIKAQ